MRGLGLRLVLLSLLLPLAVALLGYWQLDRAGDYDKGLGKERAELQTRLDDALALPSPPAGGINMDIRFRADGTTYVGDLALEKMREKLSGFDWGIVIADLRRTLPPLVIAAGGIAALLGALVLVGGAILGVLGRRSRKLLLAGFSLVRRVLPVALITLVLVSALAVLGALLFEIAPLLRFNSLGRGQVYVLGIAAGVAAIALITAWQALRQLRRFGALFEPEPYQVIAHPVDRAEARGLWELVDDFAQRLGAPVPDTIALGLAEGFFVISGPVLLQPVGRLVTGNTLHVPLGYLALMQHDEAATVIGHELAHFAGEDTAYTQRFLPIYHGLRRALDAVASAGRARDGSLSFLAAPALALGDFIFDRFHLAVQHWSRIREREADRKSATLTSPGAGARALLRYHAVSGVVGEVASIVWEKAERTHDDILPFLWHAAHERGLDDPLHSMADAVPHPTDSHPVSSERLAAFGPVTEADRHAAMTVLPPTSHALLARYFDQPETVSRAVTGGFVGAALSATHRHREALSATAAAVSEDAVALRENTMPLAMLMFAVAAPFYAGAIWSALFIPGGTGVEKLFVAGVFVIAGSLFLLFALTLLRRARTDFLVLYPDRLEHRQLDRPIFWSDVRGYSVTDQSGTMVTHFLLSSTAPLPRHQGWGIRARVLLDPRRHTITIRSVAPQHHKSTGFIALIERYAAAAAARAALGT